MANSLRAKLSKLRHERLITEEEYQAFIKKLDGHDKQIRYAVIDDCISTIVNTPTKIATHLKERQCLTMLADRQLEIIDSLKQLKLKGGE